MISKAELLSVLKECALLFAPDHAIDHFDWGRSFLRAQDIRELNELPLKINAAIKRAEEKEEDDTVRSGHR